MVLSRASSMRSALRRSTLRGSGPRVRSRFNQHIGRRTYASDHGSQKASSDIPWLIGSIAVTVPSATWLWSQGPKKGEGHSHGGHDEHAEGENHEEGGEEESKDEVEETPKEEKGGDEKDEDGGDDKAKDDDSGSDGGDGKETPPTSDDEGGEDKPSSGKGPGETSKGEKDPKEPTLA